MHVSEAPAIKGSYRVDILTTHGELVKSISFDNMLTNLARNVYLGMLNGTYGDVEALEIKYFGFGDNNTPAARTQTALENELYRKQYTVKNVSGNTITTVCSLRSGEANFHIKEIGVFCGSLATASFNTGNMLSRVVVDIEKNENFIINITRTDSIALGG